MPEQTQLEIDAWERRRQRLKKFYMELGISAADADAKATAEIRCSIITGR